MMRSYVNRLARFSSPDPLSGSSGDPQSLNLFAFVMDDPTDLTDPWGLNPCDNDPNDCVSVTADAPYIDIPYPYSGGGE